MWLANNCDLSMNIKDKRSLERGTFLLARWASRSRGTTPVKFSSRDELQLKPAGH